MQALPEVVLGDAFAHLLALRLFLFGGSLGGGSPLIVHGLQRIAVDDRARPVLHGVFETDAWAQDAHEFNAAGPVIVRADAPLAAEHAVGVFVEGKAIGAAADGTWPFPDRAAPGVFLLVQRHTRQLFHALPGRHQHGVVDHVLECLVVHGRLTDSGQWCDRGRDQ